MGKANQPKVVLGLDLGAKTGWSLYNNGKITSGTWKLVKASTKKHDERQGMRFMRLLEELNKIKKDAALEIIFYEEVHAHAGTDAAHAYGGFRSHVMSWCEQIVPNPILYNSFGVGTIKKRATGKGNSKKEQMIEAANETFKKILNRPVADDNEADALWVLTLAIEKYGLALPDGNISCGCDSQILFLQGCQCKK